MSFFFARLLRAVEVNFSAKASASIASIVLSFLCACSAAASDLNVMRQGVGSGTIFSGTPGINCGSDCNEAYASEMTVTLTAAPSADSAFAGWEGDCAGTAPTCSVAMSTHRFVRAEFDLSPAIPTLSDLSPQGIQAYLAANPAVTTPARFVKALPQEFKLNWLLMSRSESLQTGTAEFPRLLLPSVDARSVFTVGTAPHSAYPGSHPAAIEYMEWDGAEKNFRFHEIRLDAIPVTGGIAARPRGVSIDDAKCSKCHSTQNVLNRSNLPGTTGVPPGTIKAKNKPNWDTYDSWGGLLPLNRDRIFKGSVEAAAIRRIFNPWTWRGNSTVGSVIEQLELQPPLPFVTPDSDKIWRTNGGVNDGHINFAFDNAPPPVLSEPEPTGAAPSITTAYAFDGLAGTKGNETKVVRTEEELDQYVRLLHSKSQPIDEGRGVQLFDLLGGGDGKFNQERVLDELVSHKFATGGVSIDIRPAALALTKSCLVINNAANAVESAAGLPPLTINLGFFDARNGMKISELLKDTEVRKQSVPRRKADIQRLNLDRGHKPDGSFDIYLNKKGPPGENRNGLVQHYGGTTSFNTSIALDRLRQEVFRRGTGNLPDSTVMDGIYVDREFYADDMEKVALYRYFLEPLGVSVDKWSMGVRGRSRTYSFADIFSSYIGELQNGLEDSLRNTPVGGLSNSFECADLIAAVNRTLATLPPAGALPPYADVQRIFNKSCIECHGGLNYPPYSNYGTRLDLSENETPAPGEGRLTRSQKIAEQVTTTDPATSSLYKRLVNPSEKCPYGQMPCGGPALSKADIGTIRRWIEGGHAFAEGGSHIRTVDGLDYDFRAAGEFVLLRGETLEIQARRVPVPTEAPLGPDAQTGISSCTSVNNAVALRVGTQRVTYQPNDLAGSSSEALELRVDAERRAVGADGISLEGGGRIIRTPAPGGIQIDMPGGTTVIVTPAWLAHYELWSMHVSVRHARATEGIMGVVRPGNWLPALPDGRLLGIRPFQTAQRYDDLYGTFADGWRVTQGTSLFDYAAGTSPATFTMLDWPMGATHACAAPKLFTGLRAKTPLKPLSWDAAGRACDAVIAPERRTNCIQDVLVTGEPAFANAYALTQQIERNARPAAPLLLLPSDFLTDAANPVTFSWRRSSDPDNGTLMYRHCIWPVDDAPNNNECRRQDTGTGETLSTTVSDLRPGAAYFWKVIVEDGQGAAVESETRRLELRP